ncbi:MAG: prepilin-type N-terminal cleavage/methylation domain-containing protein [Pontiellaceae bacterium]|nr:prepilin-type N-terminal cleavage/methylation domain-containing protein [Pontiellaceae bacterium]
MKKSQKRSSLTISNYRKPANRSAGFTLVEVILVVVIMAVIAGISTPFFAGATRGAKLKTAGRSISQAARYARFKAISSQQEMRLVINPDTMELIVGPPGQGQNESDGKVDLDILDRLGYLDDGNEDITTVVKTEVRRVLPTGLTISNFKNNSAEDDTIFGELMVVRFSPNGQSESFEMTLTDTKGKKIGLENDPITSKVSVDFL